MDLNAYLAPLRRWWWLLLIATLVASVSSAVASWNQPDLYQTRVTLTIGRSIEDPNPTSADFFLSQQLAAAYADIANREPVRTATMEALGLSWLPDYLARALPNSQLIEIRVTDTDPLRAQVVANELANQLLLRSPTGESAEDQNRQEFLNRQLDDIQNQIDQTNQEILDLRERLGETNSARQIADLQNQIAAQQTKLTTLQSNYAALLANTRSGAINTLTIIEPAGLPRNPIGPNQLVTIGLAAAIGLTLAAGAAYLLEYLDKSIKTPEEITRIFDAPVIGYISEIREGEDERPYVADNPRSAIAEAFRSLRTNLEFAAVEEPIRTLFVTSPGPETGKTSMAVNLAIIIAQGGKRVALLDADMRRPNVHGFLGISNSEGLSDVFAAHLDVHDALRRWGQDGLNVITAGSPPPNPAELLGSKLMDEILTNLQELADIVIIDGPPFLVADASVLAAKADGVLVVVRPGFTSKDPALAMTEQLIRVGARVIGVVLNRIPRGHADYFGKYWQYAPEYSSHYVSAEDPAVSASAAASNGRPTIPALFDRFRKPKPKPATDDLTVVQEDDLPTIQEKLKPVKQKTASMEQRRIVPAPPKAMAVLRWVDHVGKRQKLVLRQGDTILIGRDRINDVIISSRHVSRRHAVVTWRDGSFEVADLGSTNGTFVNGVSADRPTKLIHSDVIRLFDIEIKYETLSTRQGDQDSGSKRNQQKQV